MTLIISGDITLKKDPVLADPYYHNVSLLLHGDGTNGSTTIVDSSPSPKAITAYGNAQISTAQSKFGGASIAFDGTGDYLTSDASIFNVGAGDFTIEWWQKLAATGVNYAIARFNNNGGIKTGASSIQLYTNVVPSINCAASTSFTTDWEHIAVVRSSGVVSIYHNGSFLNLSPNNNPSANLTVDRFEIGTSFASYPQINGFIDDFRVTLGVARYTSNFTPPTAPFPEVIG